MSETKAVAKLEFLSIWGEDHVRDVIGKVISEPDRLRELARLRFEDSARVESALARLSARANLAARQAYAFSLPRQIQEIIILECVIELNRSLKRAVSELN